MPYSLDELDKLPENVQKLPADKQKIWVNTFNSAHEACMKGDDADKDKCESSAFVQANGVVKDKKAAGDYSDSAMVAFYLPDEIASQLALPAIDAIPAEKLHITLFYLGKAEDISESQVEDIKRAIGLWAKQQIPVKVRINGIARFTKTKDGGQPIVALLDSRHLTSLQYELDSRIRWDANFDYKSEHGFLPHITLGYFPLDSLWPVQNLPELNFDLKEVIFKVGEIKYELELTGEMEYASQESSIVMVERIKAGARNSKMDQGDIQIIHDKAAMLGAECVSKADHNDDDPEMKTIWSCGIEGHEHLTPQEAHKCIKLTTLNTPQVRTEFVKSTYSDNCLKAISKTDDELVVANYMILFGGRDLEGIASSKINRDGTKGEYFTKNTQFESDYTITGQLLVDWEHRTRPDGVGPDAEDIFGYVDWKSAIIDETGLFVHRILNRRNRYVKMLEALFEAGILGSSSEPIQKGIVKNRDGEITDWPLKRDSFSVAPMDPRMLSINHLETIKALRDIPEGEQVYNALFQQEVAIASAQAMALTGEIGESL